MMLADREGEVVFPEGNQPVRFFFPVFVDIEIDPCGLRIDIGGHLARGVKCFGIGQVIYQLRKIGCHFIRVIRWHMLIAQPAVFVFLYE